MNADYMKMPKDTGTPAPYAEGETTVDLIDELDDKTDGNNDAEDKAEQKEAN